MPLGALSALMGLAGGAQAVGTGLGGLSTRVAARDAERQRTALQLLLAGYQPSTTPTAQDHPVAAGALAHSPTITGVVSVPELQPVASPFASPMGDPMAEQGGGMVAPATPMQPMVPQPTPQPMPQSPVVQPPVMPSPSSLMPSPTMAPPQMPGQALSMLIQPRRFDVPGMGAYEESPQAVQARQLAAQNQRADLEHTQAETRAANALANERSRGVKVVGHQIAPDGTPYDIIENADGSTTWRVATVEGAQSPPSTPATASGGQTSTQGPTSGASTAPTRPPFAKTPDLVPTEVPDGKGGTKTVWGPKVLGEEIPDKDKPTPALMIASMNRLGLAENDISAAIDAMERDENDPKFRAELTPAVQALAVAASTQPNPEAHGLTGLVSNAAGSLVSGKAQELMRDHPRVATYLRNKRIVGTAATEILPRPSQQLLAIEQGLSGIDVSWNPELIAGVQHRRRMMRDMLHESLQSTPLAGKTGASKSGVERGPADPMLKKYGLTPKP